MTNTNPLQTQFNQLVEFIKNGSGEKTLLFILSTHQGADYDDFSSLCAFLDYLQFLQKTHNLKIETHVCLSGILDSRYLDLCPKGDFLWQDSSFEEYSKNIANKLKSSRFDPVLTVFGCSELKRVVGNPFLSTALDLSKENNLEILKVSFDHHIHGEDWADYNLVDDKASSNAENLLDLLLGQDYKPDTKIATNLMVGLVSDTLNFFASSSTYLTHNHAGTLMGLGCDVAEVRAIMNQKWTVDHLNRLNQLVQKVEYLDLDTLEWSTIPKIHALAIIDCSSDKQVATLFKDETLDILKTEMVIVARGDQESGKFSLSIRCVPESKVKATDIAMYFDGGGHRLAAGATIEADYSGLKAKIREGFVSFKRTDLQTANINLNK